MIYPIYVLAGIMLCVSAIWLLLIKNNVLSSRYLPSVESGNAGTKRPKVSVIVPAKDEEEYIGDCIESLVKQDYDDYEVIVIDDSSSDATRYITWAYSRKYEKVSLVQAGTAPSNKWRGKNWPCAVGAAKATGSVLLFTDADTVHKPHSMRLAMDHMIEHGADTLTLTQRLVIPEFWTRITIPVVTSFKLVYPEGLVWFTPKAINDPNNKMGGLLGAYFMIKKDVYEKVGGHEAVSGDLLEDWALGRMIKVAGYKIRMADGSRLVSAVWARDLPTLEQIFSRLMLHLAVHHRLKAFGESMLLLFLLFMPYPILAGAILAYIVLPDTSTLVLLSCSALASLTHMLSCALQARMLKIPARYVVFAPLGGLMAAYGFIRGMGILGSKRAKNVWRGKTTMKKEMQH